MRQGVKVYYIRNNFEKRVVTWYTQNIDLFDKMADYLQKQLNNDMIKYYTVEFGVMQ